MQVRARLKAKNNALVVRLIILHSDLFKLKSHLKIIKKYVFSEGEQFPLNNGVLSSNCAKDCNHRYNRRHRCCQLFTKGTGREIPYLLIYLPNFCYTWLDIADAEYQSRFPIAGHSLPNHLQISAPGL